MHKFKVVGARFRVWRGYPPGAARRKPIPGDAHHSDSRFVVMMDEGYFIEGARNEVRSRFPGENKRVYLTGKGR